MQINIHPDVESELQEMVTAGGFADGETYVNDLIMRDWIERHRGDLVERARSSIARGGGRPYDAGWRSRLIAEANEQPETGAA